MTFDAEAIRARHELRLAIANAPAAVANLASHKGLWLQAEADLNAALAEVERLKEALHRADTRPESASESEQAKWR